MDKEITALYDNKNNVIMDWSPKVGCTVLTKMFFRQMGLLETALEFHSWIHEYRMHVFSKMHPITFADLQNKSIYKFKVVRNPFYRAVSSYIHTMKKPEMHQPFRKKVWQRHPNISFLSFLEILQNIDIHNCDPHYRLQKKYFEYEVPNCFNDIVHLETLQNQITDINKKQNLNFDLHGLSSHHHVERNNRNTEFVAHKKWNDIMNNIPENSTFLNNEAVEKIRLIYKDDFEAYGYSKDYAF